MLKSEVEAEELEKQAKLELKNKNYEISKSLFEKARDLYLQLNYMGKVGVIEKQLAQIKRVMEYEQRDNQKPVAEIKNMIREVHKNETKTIIQEKNGIKELQEKESQGNIELNVRKKILSDAELRRAKLREQIAKSEKETELKRNQEAKIKEREDIKKQDIQRREKEFKITTEKEKEKEILMKDAEIALDRAKIAIDNKEFKEAKVFYKEAIDNFKALGWFDQIDIVYREIKHVEFYKEEYLKRKKRETQKRQKVGEQFKKRVDSLLEEKKQKDELKLATFENLHPDIQKVIDKIKLLINKAEKEVNANIYQRALNRYQYILELYNSIPPGKINLSNEISEIEKKINELKSKI